MYERKLVQTIKKAFSHLYEDLSRRQLGEIKFSSSDVSKEVDYVSGFIIGKQTEGAAYDAIYGAYEGGYKIGYTHLQQVGYIPYKEGDLNLVMGVTSALDPSSLTTADWRAIDALQTRNLSLLKGMTTDMEKHILTQVEKSMKEGDSWEVLKHHLMKIEGMTENRARLIARTETRLAFNRGTLTRYTESGVDKVEILTAWDDMVCVECAELSGTVHPIGGEPELPLHPQCRCSYLPVIEPLPGQTYGEDFAHVPDPVEKISSLMDTWARRKGLDPSKLTMDDIARIIPKSAHVEQVSGKLGVLKDWESVEVVKMNGPNNSTVVGKLKTVVTNYEDCESDPFHKFRIGFADNRKDQLNKIVHNTNHLKKLEESTDPAQRRLYDTIKAWQRSSDDYNAYLRHGRIPAAYADDQAEFIKLMDDLCNTISSYKAPDDMILWRGVRGTGADQLLLKNGMHDDGIMAFTYDCQVTDMFSGSAPNAYVKYMGEYLHVDNVIGVKIKKGDPLFIVGDSYGEAEALIPKGKSIKIIERYLHITETRDGTPYKAILYHMGEFV